jgi:hypothetical protein
MAVVAFVVTWRLHALYLRDPGPIGFDDGYTMALGERLIDGKWLPYVDGCSHRGPLLYWMAAVAQRLTGRFGWLGTRWLVSVASLGTLVGVFATGVAGRRPFAGGVAAIFLTWSTLIAFDSSLKVTGEAVAAPFAVAALLFTTVGLLRAERPPARYAFLGLGGCAAALAGLAKQTALPTVGPLGLWVLAAAWSPDELSARKRWKMVGALTAGFAFTILVVLARYVVSGELRTFWYWYYRYNAEIYMAPYKNVPFFKEFGDLLHREPWSIGGFLIASAWGISRPISAMGGRRGVARGYASTGLEATAALLAIMMFVAAVAPMRNWPHYFICLYPFVGLLIGVQGELILKGQGSRAFRGAAHVVAAASLIGYFVAVSTGRLRSLDQAHPAGSPSSMTPEPLCAVIDSHSGPSDSLFIWGFDGDIYLTCRRHPATRFIYLTLVAGTVPPAWQEVREDRVALGAREQLLEDLRKARPPVILDMPGNMGNVSMHSISVLSAYLDEQYCQAPNASSKNGRKASVWVRRDLPACASANSSGH